MESLKEHLRTLRPLAVGERVCLQNLQGTNPTKWDRSGVVVETPGHDQYRVKVDGSSRLTLRNRHFLRAYTAASPSIDQGPRAQQQPLNREVEQTQDSPRCLPEERPHPLTSPAYLQEKSPPPQTPRLHLKANPQILLPHLHKKVRHRLKAPQRMILWKPNHWLKNLR